MSSRQLEERQERELAERVAAALDIPVADLDELDWELDENTGNDGTVYGYIIRFNEAVDAEVQATVNRITDGRGWVQIGLEL